MRTLESLFNKADWEVRIVKANQFLARPLTMLIIIALMILIVFVYFAYSNAQFQKDNDLLLRDTHASAENTERIIMDLETAVAELKADNAQQTVILCRLILGSNVTDISEREKAEIERICNAQINLNESRQEAGETSGGTSTQTPSVQTEGRRQPGPDDTDPPEEDNPPTPPDEPSNLVDDGVDFVQDTIRGIVNDIRSMF